MAPLNPLDSWALRDVHEQRQPKAKCFLVGEGANTEYWYLESLAKLLAKKGLPETIELKLVERTEGERNQSAPKKLAEHARLIKEDAEGVYGFDADTDQIIMLFDVDIYKGDEERYQKELAEFCEIAQVAVTNPSFDLFLLRHVEDALEKYVIPNEDAILANGFVGKKRRYIDKLASDALGINVKTNPAVGQLAEFFERAVDAEKALNQDSECAMGKLTSNVGLVIADIIREGVASRV